MDFVIWICFFMHPILFSIFGLNISSFGFFLALSFVLGLFIIFQELHEDFKEDDIFDSSLLSVFFGLLGSRLFYVLLNWEKFSQQLWRIIFVNANPGFSLYGGLFSGFLTLFFYCRQKKLSFLRLADAFSKGLVLAIFLGFIGSFLDGGEVGKLTNLPWGLPIVGYSGLRHPVSLYFAFYLLIIFIIFLKLKSRYLKTGSLFLILIMILGLGMMPLAFLKEGMIYWLDLPTETVLGAIFLSLAGVLLYKRLGGNLKEDLKIIVSHMRIKFPKTILAGIEKFLKKEEKKTAEELKVLSKEDPFNDTDRLIDNAASDTEVKEQVGHQRIEVIKNELNKTLIRIRKALTKIKVGKYGTCENCEKMIDTERLAANPTAVLCLECQKKKESK